MAGQRSSSSFSSTYDVFLSFHGEDTRSSFTDHLLKALNDKGIHTFMEDKELPKGDEITPALVKAIEESRIAIIVLSNNYVASSFCLDELASILDNFRGVIIPVFYHVDPDDVRHQRGTYGQALAKHEEKLKDNKEKVQKWRDSLPQVTNLSSWFFGDRHQYESQFIDSIVEDVSRKINHAADYQVGLESQLKQERSLLELESNGVLIVGIHGVGGIGKTTLARAVYDLIAHQFESLCFLDRVREKSNIYGLVHLQEELLFKTIGRNIKFGDVGEGIPIIKQCLKRKKVLLILDDVNSLQQLEALVGRSDWFGPGSRVIITTRDRNLLTFHGVETTYEVQPLNHQDSLQLLSHQVFKQGNFDPRHTEILNELVSYASGLPLSLKVIGSYLFGKSEDEWTNALHRFKRIPPKEIQMTLKTSFDALRKDEQSVFLDIACCFNGYKTEKALDILRAHHGYNVDIHIKVLIDKSLISISSDDKVTLHPLIEDMGKEIVRRESLQEPGKRSRLWFSEDIVQVLKNNTGTSNIEIIHLDSSLIEEAVKWDGDAFKKMENLRTLIVRRCHFSKAPKFLPNSLRVLEWWLYPLLKLPSDFNPNQLVICNLPTMGMGIISPALIELPETSLDDPKGSQTPLDDLESQTPPDDPKGPVSPPDDPKGSPTPPGGPQGPPNTPSDPKGPVSAPGDSQGPPNPPGDPQGPPNAQSAKWDFLKKVMLIIVFVASGVGGLICNARSPHFKSSILLVKCFPCVAFSLGVVAIVLYLCQCRKIHGFIKYCICYVTFLCISAYSHFYEKAVGGKPENWNLWANAMFALASLCLSELFEAEFETGIFNYHLQCFLIQMLTINGKHIIVAIIFGGPFFGWHFSKKPFLLTFYTGLIGLYTKLSERIEGLVVVDKLWKIFIRSWFPGKQRR